jgi:hypothetical protein
LICYRNGGRSVLIRTENTSINVLAWFW